MRRPADTAGEPRRGERGHTLVELLVASTMAMVVLGGALTVFIGAVRSEPRTSSKVSAVQQGRVAVERIVRELRQGSDVSGASAGGLSLVTYVPGSGCGGEGSASAPCNVAYSCAEGECTRTVEAPGSGSPGPAVRVVNGLTSDEVFTYLPEEAEAEPAYVGVSLSFETREGGPVVVADGAALRNGGA